MAGVFLDLQAQAEAFASKQVRVCRNECCVPVGHVSALQLLVCLQTPKVHDAHLSMLPAFKVGHSQRLPSRKWCMGDSNEVSQS